MILHNEDTRHIRNGRDRDAGCRLPNVYEAGHRHDLEDDRGQVEAAHPVHSAVRRDEAVRGTPAPPAGSEAGHADEPAVGTGTGRPDRPQSVCGNPAAGGIFPLRTRQVAGTGAEADVRLGIPASGVFGGRRRPGGTSRFGYEMTMKKGDALMFTNATIERIRATIRDSIGRNELAGCNLLVIKDGKEALYCEDGLADREAGLPIRRDTLFRIYSMSKPVTAAAAMILLERGVIDLFDPVSKYLPGFR